MKILVVSFWTPSPPDNGSRLRAWNIIRQLHGRGHELSLLALAQAETDIAAATSALLPLCAGGVDLFPSRFFQPRTLRARLGYFSPTPRHVIDTFSPDFARAVRQACFSGEFDAAMALELGGAHYIPADSPTPAMVDQLEVSPFVKAVAEAPSALSRWRRRLTVTKLRRYLRRLAPRFTLWAAVSEAEAEAIRTLTGLSDPPIQVLPNGVDLSENSFQPDAAYDSNQLVYNGSPNFSANADALRWYDEEIAPDLKRTMPQIRLWATGRNDALGPDDPLRRSDSLCLTGFLDDVRPTLRGSLACAVPLREGGGTRLKILEAMALGIPVVSTPRGAEGIGAEDGKNILLADSGPLFAQQIMRLSEDPALRARIAIAGRELVEMRYGWDAIMSEMEAALKKISLGGATCR